MCVVGKKERKEPTLVFLTIEQVKEIVRESVQRMKREEFSFDEYQKKAEKTAIYPKDRGLDYLFCGLAAEVGEMCSVYAKAIRDNNGVITEEIKQKLMGEHSDVGWFLAMIATELGLKWSDIAIYNVEKLASRKARGVLSGEGSNR